MSHCHWNVVTVFVFNLKSLRGILFPQPSPSFPMAFSTGSLFLFAAEQRYRIPNFLFYISCCLVILLTFQVRACKGYPPAFQVLCIALSSIRQRRHSLQWSCWTPVPLFSTLIRPMISNDFILKSQNTLNWFESVGLKRFHFKRYRKSKYFNCYFKKNNNLKNLNIILLSDCQEKSFRLWEFVVLQLNNIPYKGADPPFAFAENQRSQLHAVESSGYIFKMLFFTTCDILLVPSTCMHSTPLSLGYSRWMDSKDRYNHICAT